MKALGLSRKASAFFEKQVADFFALCKQSADFEVSLQNGIFRTVSAERFVIYGETVEELLQNLENRGDNSDLACERRKLLGYAYKYGEWDTDSNNNNPACRPFILKKDGKIVDIV